MMQEYQLEIKQAVHYTRCRIYRDFMQDLIADREIRTNGDSCLYAFTVLCSYANFRTSYRRLYGITYTLYPGEWAFRVSELKECLRVRTLKRVAGASCAVICNGAYENFRFKFIALITL